MKNDASAFREALAKLSKDELAVLLAAVVRMAACDKRLDHR